METFSFFQGKMSKIVCSFVLMTFFSSWFCVFAQDNNSLEGKVFENNKEPSAEEEFTASEYNTYDPFDTENLKTEKVDTPTPSVSKAEAESQFEADANNPSDRFMAEPFDYEKDMADSWKDNHKPEEIK